MQINSMMMGNYLLKIYQVSYFTYLDFYSPDEIMRLVKFPLGPKERVYLDNCLCGNNIWGTSFKLETPILNATMDKYILIVNYAYDFPCEDDDYYFEIQNVNPKLPENYTILKTLVGLEDINILRYNIQNIASGGVIR